MLYGYARISTPRQSLARQIRNLKSEYPDAVIVQETYSGTTLHRPEFEKLLKMVHPGDTIVFDSVSRMSRNAEEGADLYEHIYGRGINLVFIKEPHINTAVYRAAIQKQIEIRLSTGNQATDKLLNTILDALNEYAIDLAKQQIRLAFEQSEKEVSDLRERTREGICVARLNGKQIGRPKGSTFETKKARQAKEIILKYSKAFGGSLPDTAVMRLAGVSRNTYYSYKRILRDNGGESI